CVPRASADRRPPRRPGGGATPASNAHRFARLDFDDLQSAQGYRGFKAYRRSKLCNILYTRELARRWAGTGVTVNCLHPGFAATRFADQSSGLFSRIVRIAKTFAISPEKGAETIVYLASSPEVAHVSGRYFYRCRAVPPSKTAQDDAAAERLWLESARLGHINWEARGPETARSQGPRRASERAGPAPPSSNDPTTASWPAPVACARPWRRPPRRFPYRSRRP